MIFHFTFFAILIFSGSFGTFNTDSPRSMSPGNTVSWTLSFKKFGSGTYFEASYFDRINMTKNWLEYDRKIITPTNMNDGS